jgi:imidazolonepropionase-like amidohydrolase
MYALTKLFHLTPAAALCLFAVIAGAQSPPIAIVRVAVIPMSDVASPEILLNNQTVIVENGRIAQIGPSRQVRAPKGAVVINGRGKFLVPGLAEMHAHIPVAQDEDDELVRETLFLYLSNGITTIRGMLGDPYHLRLKEQVRAGEFLSPRVYTSSPSLNGNSVPTPEEARAKVLQYAAEGYDFLKIHPGIQLHVFEELVAAAREASITFSGHVPAMVGIRRAIDFGYASIDHIDGYVEGLVPEAAEVDPNAGGLFGYNFTNLADPGLVAPLVAATKAAGIWIVPTQSLLVRWTSPKSGPEMALEPEMRYMRPATRVQWRTFKQNMLNSPNYDADTAAAFIGLREAFLSEMHRQGVELLLGSDAPQVFNVPGFSIQHEMKAMAKAGIPPAAILRGGTVNVARFFGEEGRYGAIVAGADADLILLEDNPLTNIDNMRKIAAVCVRGEWLSRAAIDRQLEAIAKKYED